MFHLKIKCFIFLFIDTQYKSNLFCEVLLRIFGSQKIKKFFDWTYVSKGREEECMGSSYLISVTISVLLHGSWSVNLQLKDIIPFDYFRTTTYLILNLLLCFVHELFRLFFPLSSPMTVSLFIFRLVSYVIGGTNVDRLYICGFFTLPSSSTWISTDKSVSSLPIL